MNDFMFASGEFGGGVGGWCLQGDDRLCGESGGHEGQNVFHPFVQNSK